MKNIIKFIPSASNTGVLVYEYEPKTIVLKKQGIPLTASDIKPGETVFFNKDTGEIIPSLKYKAISIRQPWAWLIIHCYKNYENRTWNTKYRGDILIHAPAKFDHEGYAWVKEKFPGIKMPAPHEFARGGIVGKAYLEDVVTESDNGFFHGPFGFVMSQGNPLPFHHCKGKLGIFNAEYPG